MQKRSLWLAAAASAVAVAIPLLATASHLDVPDGNDTRGLLDVRRVDLSGSERPTWHVITFTDWTVGRVFDRGYFLVRLDTFGTARYDYYALVWSNGYRMRANLFRDPQRRRDYNVATLTAWHPTASSIKVRIPLRTMRIGKDRLDYTWQIETLFSSKNCPRVCIDQVPDRMGVAEPIPGRASPLPTTSATPTLTPSPTSTTTP
ncbi:MAG: hypothetical protein M3N53_12370 [Actinomycetota bacterium]|nr:hypothetical protein [Actinomycetota bacterium]